MDMEFIKINIYCDSLKIVSNFKLHFCWSDYFWLYILLKEKHKNLRSFAPGACSRNDFPFRSGVERSWGEFSTNRGSLSRTEGRCNPPKGETFETFVSALTSKLRGRRRNSRVRSPRPTFITPCDPLAAEVSRVWYVHKEVGGTRIQETLSSLHLDAGWANMGHLGCIIHVNCRHLQLHFPPASMSTSPHPLVYFRLPYFRYIW